MFGYLSEQLPNWQQVTLATVQSPHLKNITSSDRVKEIESTYRIYYYPTNFAVNSKGVIVARPVSATEYIKQAKQSAKPAMAK
jgi:hypothetical protein